MSIGAVLGGIAVEIAQELWSAAKAKAKQKAVEKLGKVVVEALDPKVLEALIAAELFALHAVTQNMAASLESDAAKLEASEAAFRASPNVEVIE